MASFDFCKNLNSSNKSVSVFFLRICFATAKSGKSTITSQIGNAPSNSQFSKELFVMNSKLLLMCLSLNDSNHKYNCNWRRFSTEATSGSKTTKLTISFDSSFIARLLTQHNVNNVKITCTLHTFIEQFLCATYFLIVSKFRKLP